jgi:hypothetical protein
MPGSRTRALGVGKPGKVPATRSRSETRVAAGTYNARLDAQMPNIALSHRTGDQATQMTETLHVNDNFTEHLQESRRINLSGALQDQGGPLPRRFYLACTSDVPAMYLTGAAQVSALMYLAGGGGRAARRAGHTGQAAGGRAQVHARYTAGTRRAGARYIAGTRQVDRGWLDGASFLFASLTWSFRMDDHSASPEPFDAAESAFRLLCAGPRRRPGLGGQPGRDLDAGPAPRGRQPGRRLPRRVHQVRVEAVVLQQHHQPSPNAASNAVWVPYGRPPITDRIGLTSLGRLRLASTSPP